MRGVRAAALCLPLWIAGSAAAQPAPDPGLEARYQQGSDLRERQQDAQALAVFQAIYAQTRQPRALAQVGMAEGALGRWLEAEAHLAEALATTNPWITTRRTQLESALATMRSHLGQLEVQTSVEGAAVWVEGRRIGAVNTPLRVLAGTTTFEVRAEGYVSVSRVATVPAAGLAREAVSLVAAAGEVAAPTARAAGGDTVPGQGGPPVAASPAGSGRSTVAVAALIGGGVVLVGGVIAWAYGWSQVGAYNADASCPPPETGGLPAQCQSRYDTAQLMEPLGWAGMLGGAALAGVGGVLLGTAPRAGRERAVVLSPGPGLVGAGLRVRF